MLDTSTFNWGSKYHDLFERYLYISIKRLWRDIVSLLNASKLGIPNLLLLDKSVEMYTNNFEYPYIYKSEK